MKLEERCFRLVTIVTLMTTSNFHLRFHRHHHHFHLHHYFLLKLALSILEMATQLLKRCDNNPIGESSQIKMGRQTIQLASKTLKLIVRQCHHHHHHHHHLNVGSRFKLRKPEKKQPRIARACCTKKQKRRAARRDDVEVAPRTRTHRRSSTE